MTNSIASNYVTQSMNVMVQSITTSTNKCNVKVNTGQYFFISGGNSFDCTVTATGNSNTITDMTCYASSDIVNDMTNNLSQTAQQAATSIQQQFGMLAFSEAINVSRSYMNLSNVVQTAFYNSCITDITNSQVAIIDCQNSSNFTADVSFNQTTIVTQDCVFNNKSVTKIRNDLIQYVKQSARSEIQNYIAGIMMAFAMVLFAFAAIIFLVLILISPKRKTDPPPEQASQSVTSAATPAKTSLTLNSSDISNAMNNFSKVVKV